MLGLLRPISLILALLTLNAACAPSDSAEDGTVTCVEPGSPAALASAQDPSGAGYSIDNELQNDFLSESYEEFDLLGQLNLVPSAVRQPHQSWQVALGRELSSLRQNFSTDTIDVLASASVERSARLYHDEFDISALPEWTLGEEELLKAFRLSRDERLYHDKRKPGFFRRALWLFPYNACFVRAAHVAQSMERQQLPRPGKIFAFGDLSLKTPYHPGGWVHWSYHVAPAYRFQGRVVVLDAGVESTRFLSLEEWLSRMSQEVTEVKLSVCDTFAYSPMNPCFSGRRYQERSTANHLRLYLDDEWKGLEKLGMNPEKLLGSEPPWRAVEEEEARERARTRTKVPKDSSALPQCA